MMAYHKPAIVLTATVSALCALAMAALVLAADLSNDDRALAAMRDQTMAEIRILRNPNPGRGAAK